MARFRARTRGLIIMRVAASTAALLFGAALAVGGCTAPEASTPPPPHGPVTQGFPNHWKLPPPAGPVTHGFPNPWKLPPPPPPAPTAGAVDEHETTTPDNSDGQSTEESATTENTTGEGSSEFSGYTCEPDATAAFEDPDNPNTVTNKACGYTGEDGQEHNADPWIEDQLNPGNDAYREFCSQQTEKPQGCLEQGF